MSMYYNTYARWLLKPAEVSRLDWVSECMHTEGACFAFIGMYETMQMEVLKADSVITDISVEIPKLCDFGPALMNWLYENATEWHI